MTKIIRVGSSAADAVKQCCDKAFEEYIPIIRKCPAPMYYKYAEEAAEHVLFAAFENEELIGFALVKDGDGGCMWLDVLAVSPEYRGIGIGKRLMLHVEDYILKCGKSECRLYTNTSFERTVGMYLRYEFVIYEKVFENGYERFYMKKILKGSPNKI